LLANFAGDGVVTTSSANPPGRQYVVKEESHSDLVIPLAADATLAALLRVPYALDQASRPLPLAAEDLLPLTPVTTGSLIAFLNALVPTAQRYTVLGFTLGVITSPFVRGQYPSIRKSWKTADDMSTIQVPGVYEYNGTGWYYVPRPKGDVLGYV
jgi:hypothetical protein